MAAPTFDSIQGKVLMHSHIGSDTSDLNTNFELLNGANQPATGNKNISKADPELRLTDSGNSEYTRITKSDTTNLAVRRNRVAVISTGFHALYFNTNDYVKVLDHADFDFTTAFTASFWVKRDNILGNETYLCKWDYGTNPGSWTIQTGYDAGDEIRIFVVTDAAGNYASIETTNANMAAATYYHIMVVYDGSLASPNKFKIYVDNVLKTHSETGTIPASLQNSAHNLSFGTFPGIGRFYNGIMDEIALFNIPLDATERAREYSSGLGYYHLGTESGLADAWHLDESTGTNAASISGNHDGTLYDFPVDNSQWVNGLVTSAAVMSEVIIWESKDSAVGGEEGIQTFGDSAGPTIIRGLTQSFKIGAVEQFNLADGILAPTTNNDIDLGSPTYGFKNLYMVGSVVSPVFTSSIGSLTLSNAQIIMTGSFILPGSGTPVTSGATGTLGNIKWNNNFIYVCTAANTWMRGSLFGTW